MVTWFITKVASGEGFFGIKKNGTGSLGYPGKIGNLGSPIHKNTNSTQIIKYKIIYHLEENLEDIMSL